MSTMREADDKAARNFKIAATVVVSLIFSMIYFNLPHTFLNDYHKAAGTFWQIAGVVPFLACVGFMWFGSELTFGEKTGWQYGVISVVLLALGIFMSCGWTFDLK